MSPFSYFLSLFNATAAGILYALDSRVWVLLMALIMVEAIVSAIKSRA